MLPHEWKCHDIWYLVYTSNDRSKIRSLHFPQILLWCRVHVLIINSTVFQEVCSRLVVLYQQEYLPRFEMERTTWINIELLFYSSCSRVKITRTINRWYGYLEMLVHLAIRNIRHCLKSRWIYCARKILTHFKGDQRDST